MVLVLLFTILTSLDYLTGISAAFINESIDSKITRTGLIRKSVLLLILWTLWGFTNFYVYTYIDPEFVNMISKLENLILVGFVIYEVISLIENLGLLGVKVPKGISDGFLRIQTDYDKGER